MGDKNTSWKISVKNEEDLFMDKHKPGKIRKIISGVFVFVCVVIFLYIGYEMFLYEKPDQFKEQLENGDYETAAKLFDFDENYSTLIEAVFDKKAEYDSTKDKEDFKDMWELIFCFESQIRVSDKNLYEDLRYFPKEEKVIKIGYKIDDNANIWHYEEYYNEVLRDKYYDDSQLYDYYTKVYFVNADEDAEVDIMMNNFEYELINKDNKYAKKLIEIINEDRGYGTEGGILW